MNTGLEYCQYDVLSAKTIAHEINSKFEVAETFTRRSLRSEALNDLFRLRRAVQEIDKWALSPNEDALVCDDVYTQGKHASEHLLEVLGSLRG